MADIIDLDAQRMSRDLGLEELKALDVEQLGHAHETALDELERLIERCIVLSMHHMERCGQLPPGPRVFERIADWALWLNQRPSAGVAGAVE